MLSIPVQNIFYNYLLPCSSIYEVVDFRLVLFSLICSSINAPQDAHERLVMQVAEWLTASLYQCSSS